MLIQIFATRWRNSSFSHLLKRTFDFDVELFVNFAHQKIRHGMEKTIFSNATNVESRHVDHAVKVFRIRLLSKSFKISLQKEYLNFKGKLWIFFKKKLIFESFLKIFKILNFLTFFKISNFLTYFLNLKKFSQKPKRLLHLKFPKCWLKLAKNLFDF